MRCSKAMTSRANHYLSANSYYAPLPILVVDNNQIVIDINLSMRVLLAPDIETARRREAGFLAERLHNRMEGGLFPYLKPLLSTDSGGEGHFVGNGSAPGMVLGEDCRFHSPEYGRIDLSSSAVRHLDAVSGKPTAATIYWQVQGVENRERYQQRFQCELEHTLTWDSYAISYDRILPLMPYYQEVLDRHSGYLAKEGIDTVLDLGAGTGNISKRLLAHDRNVVAIDLSREMLNRLWQKLEPCEYGKIELLQQSCEDLSHWNDGTFDAVNILLVLFDVGHPETALKEAIRVLKPGGKIVITEPRRRFRMLEILSFVEDFLRSHDLEDSLGADWRRVSSANRMIDPSLRSQRLWAEDVESRLRGAGFVDIECADSHFGNCATIFGRKGRA